MSASYLSTPLRHIAISPAELSLRASLFCGQAFRWSKQAAHLTCSVKSETEEDEFLVGHRDRTLVLRQDTRGLFYRALYPLEAESAHAEDVERDTTAQILRTYFALGVKLADLLAQWEKSDVNFRKKTKGGQYGGIRVLKQDPWETLISFICSSNNNIGRITLMLNRICTHYGEPLPLGQFAFPTIESLADDEVEPHLRELGFGYRAPYVVRTAQMLASEAAPHDVLAAVASLATTEEQREALTQYAGVGPKVADCIRLFGLGKTDVVPVDVHIARLAVRDYGVKGFKEGNKESYEMACDVLRKKWGITFAGWAQQILFAAEVGSNFEPRQVAVTPSPIRAQKTAVKPKREVDEDHATPTKSKRKVESEDAFVNPYPSPLPTPPVAKAMSLAFDLVEAMHPKQEPKQEDLGDSLAERTKLRKRRKVKA